MGYPAILEDPYGGGIQYIHVGNGQYMSEVGLRFSFQQVYSIIQQGFARASTAEIRAAQTALNARPSSLPHISVDGQYGVNTAEKLVEFQSRNGLTRTGILDVWTAAKLNIQAFFPGSSNNNQSSNSNNSNNSATSNNSANNNNNSANNYYPQQPAVSNPLQLNTTGGLLGDLPTGALAAAAAMLLIVFVLRR